MNTLIEALHFLGVILNSMAIIYIGCWGRKMSQRVTALETVYYTKQWLSAIEAGESPSDMAYMRERGFLK